MIKTRSGEDASNDSTQSDALLTRIEDPLPGLISSLREKNRRESEEKEKTPSESDTEA